MKGIDIVNDNGKLYLDEGGRRHAVESVLVLALEKDHRHVHYAAVNIGPEELLSCANYLLLRAARMLAPGELRLVHGKKRAALMDRLRLLDGFYRAACETFKKEPADLEDAAAPKDVDTPPAAE